MRLDVTAVRVVPFKCHLYIVYTLGKITAVPLYSAGDIEEKRSRRNSMKQ